MPNFRRAQPIPWNQDTEFSLEPSRDKSDLKDCHNFLLNLDNIGNGRGLTKGENSFVQPSSSSAAITCMEAVGDSKAMTHLYEVRVGNF